MGTITVSNLGKAYKRYPNRWSRLAEWIAPGSKARHQLKWVLKDLSFSITSGEAVGIIGINGAGKSTLLKMLTGTTQPTTGVIGVRGRIAALLELGMGFHPDFTGRQNAFMAGQLLGYSVEEIGHHMAGIEAFAEIGEYIDQPVRVYSSGMQVRLAFSVATAYRPDVLIVDEALAVGDVYFQQKCYQRIRQYLAAGTTLLFVTHGMGTVLELCSRAIYLRQGGIVYDGPPKEAVDLYQADLLVRLDQAISAPAIVPLSDSYPDYDTRARLRGGAGSLSTEIVTCTQVQLINKIGAATSTLLSEEYVRLTIGYRVHQNLDDPHVGFKIRNHLGAVIFETNTYCMHKTVGFLRAGCELKTNFSFPINLSPGDYTITVGMANKGYAEGTFEESLSYLHDVLIFKVLPNPSSITWAGVVNVQPDVSWSTT